MRASVHVHCTIPASSVALEGAASEIKLKKQASEARNRACALTILTHSYYLLLDSVINTWTLGQLPRPSVEHRTPLARGSFQHLLSKSLYYYLY